MSIQGSSEWLTFIKNSKKSKKTGKFLAKDKYGVPVVLEWTMTGIRSSDYPQLMKSVSELAVSSYVPVEMEFLKKYPNAVTEQDLYLKSFYPFFKNGIAAVDWNAVEEKLKSMLKTFYFGVADLSIFAEEIIKVWEQDIYFFATVKDQATQKLLGFRILSISSGCAFGDTLGHSLAILSQEQNRGLGKLLMSSIFKIVPQVKRIFLITRITNNTAYNAFQKWGFTKTLKPIDVFHFKFDENHWTSLEYKTDNSNILQKVAEKFVNLD
ncbi:TPA: hypothetical protein DEO28_00130 [Candidatus Dependentiae bacterium]|nr:MAG: hypothetical protein UR14_C0001G0116 [candidate division TM6 bacterium GW2011_GWE2_31_21]KKP54004.1 MAG: hypothetical protein UR43_C0001G0022 [candidate division TM6 bacterium GW2011_GWF2_33_332]HBS48415.1 hypothetical protein [Candidatus Dependentiae bacterium]HBZ72911.1 hypothetical protein [Candidatus Dependentiae bacterium]